MRIISLILSLIAIFVVSDAMSAEIIYFSSLDTNLKLAGWLFMPKEASGPVPAMVVMHGTSGIDSRVLYFAEELPKIGVAAFLVDYKTGVFTSPENRPQSDLFQPVAFAALEKLSSRNQIDSNKIGIMGFALGGQITLASTLQQNIDKWLGEGKSGFKLHLAYYPGCKYFLNKLKSSNMRNSPLKLYYGTQDSYGEGEFCPQLKDQLSSISFKEASFISFDGASTGFDGPYPVTYHDALAIDQKVVITPNEKYKNLSRSDAMKWIKINLSQK